MVDDYNNKEKENEHQIKKIMKGYKQTNVYLVYSIRPIVAVGVKKRLLVTQNRMVIDSN